MRKITVRAVASIASGPNGRTWRLSVNDEASGARLLELNLSLEQFSTMIGASSTTGIEAEVLSVEDYGRVGRRLEVRSVPIPFEGSWTTETLAGIYDDVEERNPGWQVDRDMRWNSHRVKGGTYTVTLRRWVDD